MSSLCREETPYNWEGEYREAHGGGGRWGSELWGELPCMDEVRSFKLKVLLNTSGAPQLQCPV
jgi:hypothetical protein